MNTFIQAVVTGILLGGLYGLFSSGLTLIFGITRVINFAHGDFVTLGMFAAIILYADFKINPLIAIFPIACAGLIAGWLVYKLIIQRTLVLKESEDALHSQLVLTLAVSILITNGLLMAFGPSAHSINGVLVGNYEAAGLFFGKAQVVAFLIALFAFVLLYLVLTKTLYGKAIRSTVDDTDMATMVGINTRTVYAASFSIGIALTGIAGAVLATYYPVTPLTGQGFLVIAFVTVVLGGLGDVVGAFFAGLIVGVIQQLSATYIALDLQNAVIFIVFILILAFRPQGLLGGRTAR
jgi:branched-chain amino acid transport system permease protein